MSTYAVQGETLGLIADAIRGKLGTDEPMEVSSMASLIEGIPSGGDDKNDLERALERNGFKRVEFNPSDYEIVGNYITVTHNLGRVPTDCMYFCRKMNNTSKSNYLLGYVLNSSFGLDGNNNRTYAYVINFTRDTPLAEFCNDNLAYDLKLGISTYNATRSATESTIEIRNQLSGNTYAIMHTGEWVLYIK